MAQTGTIRIGNATYPFEMSLDTHPVSGTVTANVASSALPIGASTSALQTSGNSLLTDIKANQTNGTQAVKMVQNVTADANNSSTTNLDTPTYSFTGTSTPTLGVAGIQVSLYANKNCKVIVQQSQDGTNWDLSDTYYYTASSSFGITVQAVSSYVRVLVSSNNETTTVFRLQTALCPVIEAVPRSLDHHGNFKVAMGEDEYGWQCENTPMGEQRCIEPMRVAGTSFEGTTIDSSFWTTSASGTSASIAQANAQILLTSGTSNGATVTAYSFRRARYIGGQGMRYRAVVQLSTGETNNLRRWGIGYGATMPTITDGAWFQLDGSEFAVVTCKGTTPTKVTAFNGNLGATYVPSTGALTYEIYWTNTKVYFVIGDTILHTVTASSATWASTMSFHVFMDSLNAGIITGTTMAVRTATIYRLGSLETLPIYKNIAGVNASTICKYGGGTLHSIIIGTPVNNATIAVYDNVTGTGNPIMLLTLPNSAVPFSIDPHLPFFSGLNIVPSSTSLNITVVYE